MAFGSCSVLLVCLTWFEAAFALIQMAPSSLVGAGVDGSVAPNRSPARTGERSQTELAGACRTFGVHATKSMRSSSLRCESWYMIVEHHQTLSTSYSHPPGDRVLFLCEGSKTSPQIGFAILT